jgi:aminoglycoside 6-adenylyltransferase
MNDPTPAYEQLIEKFIRWAADEENIRAAVVIGSRARKDQPADEWADLDLILFAHDPQPLLAARDWVEKIGTPWITFLEPTPDGQRQERRVLFEGGLDVDFVPISVAFIQKMISEGVRPEVADIIRRGVRVLLDKDGLMARWRAAASEPPPPAPPSQAEFSNLVNDFWYHALWTARHLRRGELWWAKSGCDSHMKGLLRRMLEWHARAMKGPHHEIWFRGRFLEQWADPRAVQALRRAFAHYDASDVWRALFATMELFRWLARETAERLTYDYPNVADARATELVHRLYEGRGC